MTYAEFSSRQKWLRLCHRQRFTKFRKFPQIQQFTKLRDFIRESGEVLSYFIPLPLSTVADVASLTCGVLVFQFAVCCGTKCSRIVVNSYYVWVILAHLKEYKTHERPTPFTMTPLLWVTSHNPCCQHEGRLSLNSQSKTVNSIKLLHCLQRGKHAHPYVISYWWFDESVDVTLVTGCL